MNGTPVDFLRQITLSRLLELRHVERRLGMEFPQGSPELSRIGEEIRIALQCVELLTPVESRFLLDGKPATEADYLRVMSAIENDEPEPHARPVLTGDDSTWADQRSAHAARAA